MASFEDNTHVFIVRVWLERREIQDAHAEWRWAIEHVPTGARRYFRDLEQACAFIAAYLEGREKAKYACGSKEL